MFEALREGLRLAIGFSPLASLLASAAVAMLLARRPGPLRLALALLVIVGAWFGADGYRLWAHAVASAETGTRTAGWLTLGVWALGGLAAGYLLPAWAGTFVGRRVTFGTGWASAGVVAASVAGLLQAFVTRLGG